MSTTTMEDYLELSTKASHLPTNDLAVPNIPTCLYMFTKRNTEMFIAELCVTP